MSAPAPRIVIESHTRRDAFIAIAAGLLVMVFIGYGIMRMAAPVPGNKLTGIVTGKEFTPFKERQIDFSGRKVEAAREVDGEYVLKVRVDSEHRTYEVPVEKPVYETKKAGDSFTFLRPLSEQR